MNNKVLLIVGILSAPLNSIIAKLVIAISTGINQVRSNFAALETLEVLVLEMCIALVIIVTKIKYNSFCNSLSM